MARTCHFGTSAQSLQLETTGSLCHFKTSSVADVGAMYFSKTVSAYPVHVTSTMSNQTHRGCVSSPSVACWVREPELWGNVHCHCVSLTPDHLQGTESLVHSRLLHPHVMRNTCGLELCRKILQRRLVGHLSSVRGPETQPTYVPPRQPYALPPIHGHPRRTGTSSCRRGPHIGAERPMQHAPLAPSWAQEANLETANRQIF